MIRVNIFQYPAEDIVIVSDRLEDLSLEVTDKKIAALNLRKSAITI